MSAYNDELFQRVLRRIDDNPASFDMNEWLREGECGTVGCFAGQTVMELGYTGGQRWDIGLISVDGVPVLDSVSSLAMEALGLSWAEADKLFAAASLRPDGSRCVATRDDVVRRWKEIKDGDLS